MNSRALAEVTGFRELAVKLGGAISARTIEAKASLRWLFRPRSTAHGLPGKLVVSLTSYPPRFSTLPLTLKCLLTQTIGPDRLLLWIAHDDKESLTGDIWALTRAGLEIKFCQDLKSYKKIIPALEVEPSAFLVTADDDVYYASRWLEEFVDSYSGNNREILCQRAHSIRLDREGLPLPYRDWAVDIPAGGASTLTFPTGTGGVFYPPGVFHSDVANKLLYKEYCPKADDLWLYWMARRNGAMLRKVGPRRRFTTWRNTQADALWHENVLAGGNDVQIQRLIDRYGFPQAKKGLA